MEEKTQRHSRILWISLGIAIALVFIVGIGVTRRQYQAWTSPRAAEEYSVVYLRTGEIYLGKLLTASRFELRDGYSLVIVPDPQDKSGKRTQFQLNPLRDAVWAPKTLYLNKDQIIFWGPLDAGSRAAEALRGAQKK